MGSGGSDATAFSKNEASARKINDKPT